MEAEKTNYSNIKKTLLVMSGKGGVGKSTVAANLAMALMLKEYKVGLLDVDIHGPSIPKLLGLGKAKLSFENETILPVQFTSSLKVLSSAFLLDSEESPIIYRGPAKHSIIKQFINETKWGDLDYLVIDAPPGTGDEPLSVVQLLPENTYAIIVTTPQDVAILDVKKSISFCRKLNIPVLGIIENMSGFVCPDCKKVYNIFKQGGAKKLSSQMDVPLLGEIPIEINIVNSGDAGKPFVYQNPEFESSKAFINIVTKIISKVANCSNSKLNKKELNMRFAVPTINGKLNAHFGHSEDFTFVDVDEKTKKIIKTEVIKAPEHQPGIIPPWVAKNGAKFVIAGGMGSKAQDLFKQAGVDVIVGAPCDTTAEKLVLDYLNNKLVTGNNVCDH